MITAPSSSEVLNARESLPRLFLDVANDLYRATWQVSHVRLVELVPNSSATLAQLLAYVFDRSTLGEWPLEVWLQSTRFQPRDWNAVANLVRHAQSDMAEEDRWPNDTLASSLSKLSPTGAEFFFETEACTPEQHPSSPYRYGPTYQMFWGSLSRLYFLEVHNES